MDDSSSMAGPLWWEAKEALTQLAELAAKYDEDGLDIHFLCVPMQRLRNRLINILQKLHKKGNWSRCCSGQTIV